MCEDDGRLKTSATIIERLFLHDRGARVVLQEIFWRQLVVLKNLMPLQYPV
jgi:hypothetical protein